MARIAGFYVMEQLLTLSAEETLGERSRSIATRTACLRGVPDWIVVDAALGAVSLLAGMHNRRCPRDDYPKR